MFFAAIAMPFTDADLLKWERTEDRALILVVSDGMPYSQKSRKWVLAAAAQRKLNAVVLSDRKGVLQEKQGDSLMQSDRLASKGALRHFPSLFLIRDHQLMNQVVPGIQTAEELDHYLNENLP